MAKIGKLWLSCWYVSIWLISVACNSRHEADVQPNKVTLIKGKCTLVLNEGNFTRGNAAVTLWQDDRVIADVFSYATGRLLGDVLQSLYIKGDTGYFVVNNSGKIEVIYLPEFRHLHTIKGLTSPRYIVPVGNGKAVITEYYSNKIHLLNLYNFNIERSLTVPGWVNKAVCHQQKIYFPLVNKPGLLVVDLIKWQITDSMACPTPAGEVIMDKQGTLWLAAGIQTDAGVVLEITRINNRNLSNFRINDGSLFTSMQANPAGDTIYILSKHFYRIAYNSTEAPTPHITNQQGINYYGFGVQQSGHIFLSNARDFVSRGEVEVYSKNGQKIATFPTGFIPQDIHFY